MVDSSKFPRNLDFKQRDQNQRTMKEKDHLQSSNNDHYRVRPVYGFVAAKGTHKLEVMRLAGKLRNWQVNSDK